MEKLVKLNEMRLKVLKKCLYRSHHLGVQSGLQESVSWRLLDCEDSFPYLKAATSSLFTCKHCGQLMTSFGHIVSCQSLLWLQRLNAERMNIAAVELTKWLIKRYL